MATIGVGLATLLLAGCASPGLPLSPSLKLPEVVAAAGLTANRVGDSVTLRWTTPSHTTDKLLISGPITAEICRRVRTVPAPAGVPPCAVVGRVTVTSGDSEAVDALPADLIAGPPLLLAYRVQLLNAAGRTAGPSGAVFAAAGPAPVAVGNFQARSTKAGVLLEWVGMKNPGGHPDIQMDALDSERNATTVELARTTVAGAAAPAASKTGLPDTKEPVKARFLAGATDAGGTVDRTALVGRTYRYTAQRVRSVSVGGQTLEVRSAPSAEVTLEVRDVFPPDAPGGLVTVPGYAGEKPAIDLSWDPNMELRISGYRVYRRAAGSGPWQRLGDELVRTASYRDVTVAPGMKYEYRVTAVNQAGNESAPSAAVQETAPAQ
jgi:hypothetical protein